MKHHRIITRVPKLAQDDDGITGDTTLEAKVQFKVQMVDRLVVFVFQTWGNSML